MFLPLTLLVYYLCKEKYRNAVLLLASIIFFLWGSSQTILIIIVSLFINYLIGYALSKRLKRNKTIVALGVIFNVLLLVYYKYSNFFINTFNQTLGTNLTLLKLIVPLGVSYITFQQISFIVDIYKDKVKFDNNIIDYSLYILFFPKLIAGPITQYHNIQDSLVKRSYSDAIFNDGIYRFSIGLGKKIIISSILEMAANNIFELPAEALSFNITWIGMITYTLQIYFDFSGYTDMAIGVAKMFSITLPENFNKPYKAKGFEDFWRRWHITLSSFLRDYIYIPLGGNRVSKKRALFNTLVIFLISGFWHGANFTFIIWGLYHGIFVILEKLGLKKLYKILPSLISQFLTFILVGIGWIFFRADNLAYGFDFIKNMFNFSGNIRIYGLGLDFKFWVILTLALILVFIPKLNIKKNKISLMLGRSFSLLILIYSISIITTGSFMPFIYFNF